MDALLARWASSAAGTRVQHGAADPAALDGVAQDLVSLLDVAVGEGPAQIEETCRPDRH